MSSGNILFSQELMASLNVQGLCGKLLSGEYSRLIDFKSSIHVRVCLRMFVLCVIGDWKLVISSSSIVRLLLPFGREPFMWSIFIGFLHTFQLILQSKANHLSRKIRPLWNLCLHALMWNIWLERNRRVFEDRCSYIEDFWLSFVRVLGVWAKNRGEFRSYTLVSLITTVHPFFPLK